MKNALVTGGAGFIGSNVVDALLRTNEYKVTVLDDMSTGRLLNVSREAKLIIADIRKKKEIESLFEGMDVVFHLAALPRVEPSIKDPVTFNKINVDGMLNVFECAREAGVKNIVFSSSSSVYGEPTEHPTPESSPMDPMSPYALQKQIGEEYAKLYVKLYGMNISCLRYFNVYGFREPTEGMYVPVIGIWLRQLEQGKPLTVTGTGDQTRDFVNVLDVANANVLCGDLQLKGKLEGFKTFNVGSGRNYALNETVDWFEAPREYLPERIEPKITLADTSRLNKLGWSADVDFETYVKHRVAAVRKGLPK